MRAKTIKYRDAKAELLKNPEVREAYDELEPAQQVARLRTMRKLTQQQLAEMVGTQQPSIARLESGKSAPDLNFLKRVVEAMGGRLSVKIEAPEGLDSNDHGDQPSA
jgi:transcriptional regulator with XRE-family HTH domain